MNHGAVRLELPGAAVLLKASLLQPEKLLVVGQRQGDGVLAIGFHHGRADLQPTAAQSQIHCLMR